MEEKMKLRKKHVAIILILGMVLTSTGPILADQVTSPGVETVLSDPKPKDTNKSEIIVSPDAEDPKLDPNSSLAFKLGQIPVIRPDKHENIWTR